MLVPHSILRGTPARIVGFDTRRGLATVSTAKKEGNISSVFVSLSGTESEPLPSRFADLKGRLIGGHEDLLRDSWKRLLRDIREEIEVVAQLGCKVVPEIQFKDLGKAPEPFQIEHRKRGVAIIRDVVPESTALQYKEDIRAYVKDNPQTKAFPPNDPQVFELYWSPSQIRARAHPNLIATQRFLMEFWHSKDQNALISSSHPTAYADRLRIRQPGDAGFALGPHVDGGSVERWEEEGYGRGGVYDKIWQGKWEEYDPWESSCRLPAVADLYNGAGACSMFRMYQGWLAMSTTGPGEGTLLVNPLFSRATVYFLLRPFFSPRRTPDATSNASTMTRLLDSNNWQLDPQPSSLLQGATPSHAQELNATLHPHLDLARSMVHVPEVRPGDYVAWHCDTIHAVDKTHTGSSDSSVMYIPACPLTEANAEYLVRQREAFVDGTPGPDFPGGKGESEHLGRYTADYVQRTISLEAQRAMGLAKWDMHEPGLRHGQRKMLERANEILGF
ncbi:MAG: hypothetical protein M1835_006643 [Candelina submexicana]|nr:MAG: hypothetical protein M1835_006643 [Candelina submexicana]